MRSDSDLVQHVPAHEQFSAPDRDAACRRARQHSGQSGRRSALVAGEIAIAVVVLFLSTLVVRSFQKLLAVDPGFRTDHLLSAEITLPEPKYGDGSPVDESFL